MPFISESGLHLPGSGNWFIHNLGYRHYVDPSYEVKLCPRTNESMQISRPIWDFNKKAFTVEPTDKIIHSKVDSPHILQIVESMSTIEYCLTLAAIKSLAGISGLTKHNFQPEDPNSFWLTRFIGRQKIIDHIRKCKEFSKKHDVDILPFSPMSIFLLTTKPDKDYTKDDVKLYWIKHMDEASWLQFDMERIGNEWPREVLSKYPDCIIYTYEDLFFRGNPTGTFLDNYPEEIQAYHKKNMELYEKWMKIIN